MEQVEDSNVQKSVKGCPYKGKPKESAQNVKRKFTKGKRTKLLNKREYKEKKWKEREVVEGDHFSHVEISFNGDIVSSQKIPGFCLLCTNQFHAAKPSIMKYHFHRVHLKGAIIFHKKKHLLCKCTY